MSNYVPTFTTGVIQPSNVAYRAVSISANYSPVWPSKAANTPEVVANLMEVSATVGGLNIVLPPANQVGNGTTVIWRNTGANTFNIVDQNNNAIQTITAGQIWAVYLQDDSTAQGTWSSFQFSATTSSATPGPLAGLGLVAITTTLNQAHPVVATAVSGYTVGASDRAEVLNWTGGVGTINLPSAAVIGNNFFLMVRNSGTGILTVAPNGADLIDSSATLSLNPTESCFVICSGAGWNTVGIGRSTVFVTTQLIIPVGGNTDVTLTTAQATNQLLQFTGVLTGNINVIVPTSVASYHVFNNTTGAFTLTVKTVAGTGVLVPQGLHAILDCDATNVVSADSVFTAASIVPCTATGANAIALTPVSGTFLSYVNQQIFTFAAPATTTGAVTLNVSAVGAGSLFQLDGTTPVAGLVSGQVYAAMRVNTLSGFVLIAGTLSAASGTSTYVAEGLINRGQNITPTGNGADLTLDTLQSFSVPASTLAVNGQTLEIDAWGTLINNGDTKNIAITFGGTTIIVLTTTSGATTWRLHALITRLTATTQAMVVDIANGNTATPPGAAGAASASPGETLTGAVTLAVKGQNTSNPTPSSVVCNVMLVRFRG